MKINFVTTNEHKFQIAQAHIRESGRNDIEVVQYDIETPEIQSESVEEIAMESAIWVSRKLGQSAIAADAGFSITALNGFPGPFMKYINEWLSPEDILKLMKGASDRSATFIDALAYADPSGEVKVFSSNTLGKIIDTDSPPQSKWTVDAVFIPEGYDRPMSELSDEEKNNVWNTDRWDQLIRFLDGNK